MTNGKPVRSLTMTAPHRRTVAQVERDRVGDRGGKCAEISSEMIHTEHRRKQQTLRDPLAPLELLPDLLAFQESQSAHA